MTFWALTRKFWREEDGQDTMEYTLLLGFVALAAAAIFPVVTDSIKVIWNVASNHLANAASAAES
jgi:Flp pilus assembly pilin Flp